MQGGLTLINFGKRRCKKLGDVLNACRAARIRKATWGLCILFLIMNLQMVKPDHHTPFDHCTNVCRVVLPNIKGFGGCSMWSCQVLLLLKTSIQSDYLSHTTGARILVSGLQYCNAVRTAMKTIVGLKWTLFGFTGRGDCFDACVTQGIRMSDVLWLPCVGCRSSEGWALY